MCNFVHSLHKDLRNIYTCKSGTNVYDEVSRNAHNGETNAKQDRIELERSASFQCSMFNVQWSCSMFCVLCTMGEVA